MTGDSKLPAEVFHKSRILKAFFSTNAMFHVDNFQAYPQSLLIFIQQKKQAYRVGPPRYACYDPVSSLDHSVFPDIIQYFLHKSSSVVSAIPRGQVFVIRSLNTSRKSIYTYSVYSYSRKTARIKQKFTASTGLLPAPSYRPRPFSAGISTPLPKYFSPSRRHCPWSRSKSAPGPCPPRDFPGKRPESRRRP